MINREKATTGQVSGGRPDLHCASRIYGAGHLIDGAQSISMLTGQWSLPAMSGWIAAARS